MKKITFLMCFLGLTSFAQTVGITSFATGFSSPTELTHAGDARMFLVQQNGVIKIINPNGSVNATSFLTITNAKISFSGNERGLLGLAFHPNFATNGYFYVNYTRAGDGATAIERYSVSANNPNVADPSSGTVILTVPQPFNNHNGGTIKFGPDGYLYIGMGDGGSGGDPGNRAQNINENLGKMLRIDVNSALPYVIPSDNPYVGIPGNDEIWAIGLRNPWKYSFDRGTGDLWIADVGQNAVEEINRVNSTAAGLNYGWKCYEGNATYTAGCAQATTNYTFPIRTLTHSGDGAGSITGGYVYNGTQYPNFVGRYFFTDLYFNKIGVIDTEGALTFSQAFSNFGFITTFGEDVNGELYVVSADNGIVYKIIDTSLSTDDFAANGLSLYPNPTSSTFTIENKNGFDLKQLQLHDLSGKLLLQQNLTEANTQLNVELLQSGIYLVSVSDTSGNLFTTKLVVK